MQGLAMRVYHHASCLAHSMYLEPLPSLGQQISHTMIRKGDPPFEVTCTDTSKSLRVEVVSRIDIF